MLLCWRFRMMLIGDLRSTCNGDTQMPVLVRLQQQTIDDLICWDCWWNSHDETAKE